MDFKSVKRGNFSGLASSVNRNADAIFKAARDTAVDNTAIAKEAIKGRSMERRAAMEAEGKVAQAGLKAFASVKDTKNKVESEQKIADIKRPARRMAGIVGGLGALAGGYVMMEGNKRDKAERDAFKAERDAVFAQQGQMQEAFRAQQTKFMEELQSSIESSGGSSDPKPNAPAPTAAGSTKSALISSGDALDSGKGSAGSGNLYSQAQIQSFAQQAGFSPENAKIMAAIGMGESRGNSGIDTVQSGLDPGKKNEYSIGLTQINVQAHGDKLTRRGWTAEDLRDPVKNLTIAKEVYDEVGSFKPWSVYTSGKYTEYLK